MLLRRRPRRILLAIASVLLLLLVLKLVTESPKRSWRASLNLGSNGRTSGSEANRKIKVIPGVLMCRPPDLDPFDKEMMKHFKTVPPVTCKATLKNWVEVIDGRFVIMTEAKKKYGNITCRYIPFIRKTDHTTVEGAEKNIENNTLIPYDFFRANCTSDSGTTYVNVHAGIRVDDKLHKTKRIEKNGLGLDVLIIGFDSVSRMTYTRKLPETLKYMTDVLNGIVLNGYNIVGDGTPQALIPILTGKTELELPRPLKRLQNGLHVDVFPMAWTNFSKAGYVTAFSEDAPSIGTFTYRMTGFKDQPTDHYMRTFHLNVQHPLCIGDRPRSEVVLDWMRDFMRMYRKGPKFGFMFHNELSHDSSDLIQTTDTYLRDTLRSLNDQGILSNTMLILMSDHGARFSGIRSSLQGKQEERNPFFAFSFPRWFKEKHPKAYGNFQSNSHRLVTPFDIHSTLMDVLEFQGDGYGSISDRAISLFKEIPLGRTCQDAGIEPHWCNCLQWTPIQNNETVAEAAAKALVDHINNITEFKRDVCVQLYLKQIVRSAILESSKDMLAFKKTVDLDGYKPDLSDTTEIDSILLQVTIYTSPNNGMYESTVRQNIKTNAFIVKTDGISRINKYGNDPHCIHDTQEQLRKYCYCKDNLEK